MARGLTELDVHHAADDIVSLGERPTVERIRAHLGSGSPNTVTRWLETWWSSVGARLRQRAIEADRPDVPEAVLALAQRCWNAALQGAGEQAQRDLAATRAALADEAAQLAAGHELHAQGRQELQLAQAQTAAAQTSIELLRTQLAEATAHAHELRTQRDGSYARAERLEQQLTELRNERDLLQQTHQTERQEMAAHFRSTEDRLNREVDRARQEARGLTESMSKQAKTEPHSAANTGGPDQHGRRRTGRGHRYSRGRARPRRPAAEPGGIASSAGGLCGAGAAGQPKNENGANP